MPLTCWACGASRILGLGHFSGNQPALYMHIWFIACFGQPTREVVFRNSREAPPCTSNRGMAFLMADLQRGVWAKAKEAVGCISRRLEHWPNLGWLGRFLGNGLDAVFVN